MSEFLDSLADDLGIDNAITDSRPLWLKAKEEIVHIEAQTTAKLTEMRDALRRLFDFHASGDLPSAQAVASQAQSVLRELDNFHSRMGALRDKLSEALTDKDEKPAEPHDDPAPVPTPTTLY